MELLRRLFKKIGKICYGLFLFTASCYIIYTVVDFWFLYRLVHDGHYWINGGSEDTNPIIRFLVRRVRMNDMQYICYGVIFLFLSFINYSIIKIKIASCHKQSNAVLKFSNKYFCILLFTIANLRFFGDFANYNIDKMGWYFIFVAIPTYLQLMAFCIVFFVILRNKREELLSKLIYALPNHWVGRIFMYLSILYLTYYTAGCITDAICYQPDVFPNDFYFIGKPIKTIIQRFCFDNSVVVAINLGILLVSSCIYACILRMLNIKNRQSEKNGFNYIIKAFTLLMMFVSTVKYGSECLDPTDRYTYKMIIDYIYWPLMVTSVLLLYTLHHKEKAEKKENATI